MVNLDGIKKILIVRNDNIGDVIVTTPSVEALRKCYPDAYIAILVADYTREAIDGNPYLNKVYSYQKAKHAKDSKLIAWWRQYKIIREIRREKFDLAIGIRNTFSASQGWLVFASGAPMRLGHYPKKRRLSFFYNIYADKMYDKCHEVLRSLNILKKINVDIEKKELSFSIPEEDESKIREFIERNNLKKGKKLVCLHISRRQEEGRWWDTKNYMVLADLLMERNNMDLVFNWPPNEIALADEILSGIGNRPTVFISDGIKHLASFLKECDLLITLEGGCMHISAAVKTPTIVIFGKTDPEVWHPWGDGHIVLKREDNPNSVTVEDVMEAVDKMIGERH